MMKILYICPRFPYPPYQGAESTIYKHLKYLSKNNKITLLTMVRDEEELAGLSALYKFCENIETFKKRPNASIYNLIRALFTTEPVTVIRYYSKVMFRRAKELVESGDFDVVHVAFYYMAQYTTGKDIKIPGKTALVIDAHVVEYLLYAAHAGLAENIFVRLFLRLEASRIKRYEFSAYKKFDRCIAVSESDRVNIVRLSGASNVLVNPAPIEPPVSEKEAFEGRDEEKKTILFFGSLGYPPNRDGIKFFYKNIFPLIKKDLPDAKFIIAGKSPDRYVLGLARDPSVRFAGFVPSIRDFMKKVSLVVVPLRIGGGIRIKILEAWAAGKAVVSTSIGAGGVETSDGSDIIIADSASDFADSVVRLLGDDAQRMRIGRAALKKAAELYDPEKIGLNLENIYKEAVRGK